MNRTLLTTIATRRSNATRLACSLARRTLVCLQFPMMFVGLRPVEARDSQTQLEQGGAAHKNPSGRIPNMYVSARTNPVVVLMLSQLEDVHTSRPIDANPKLFMPRVTEWHPANSSTLSMGWGLPLTKSKRTMILTMPLGSNLDTDENQNTSPIDMMGGPGCGPGNDAHPGGSQRALGDRGKDQ